MLYKKSQHKEYFCTYAQELQCQSFYNHITALQFSDLFISCKIVNYIGIEFEQEIYSSYNTTNFPNFPCFYNNAT